MKKHIIFAIGLIAFVGCKEVKKEEAKEQEKELSILEKVAHAHGFKNFKNAKEITFTFNVDRDTTHFQRSWLWNTATNTVETDNNGEKITYHRNSVDSLTAKVDAGFINDKYWLLAPFNLIWDKDNFSFDHQNNMQAPISKAPMQRLTIVYGNEGGYTPGDAYDFYFGPDFIIKEWVFRRGNQKEASTITTWEDYVDTNGLKIAKMHKNEDGSFKLYFTDLKVNSRDRE
ncbi:hypothetical protein [Arenibacter certesii]|uniref:Selenophosphate synthetase n=1 Tax=Arenibacter certesii TaxID=228955 RepID=A0A918IML9_9FLAO|nr:hypothetical protein [Arenibacter certesii]GGW23121.1 hypothetical protein GCM10007383_03920 [Arenibacter certesii]